MYTAAVVLDQGVVGNQETSSVVTRSQGSMYSSLWTFLRRLYIKKKNSKWQSNLYTIKTISVTR
jgi:hypothetical protein